MAKYKLTAAQKRNIKSQVRVNRTNGGGIPRSTRTWSFRNGDLVKLNVKGMRYLGLDSSEPPWGVISDPGSNSSAAGTGYFNVLTSAGLSQWHGSHMDRIQIMEKDTEDV
jgi:methionine aminopeptidase